MSGYNFEINGIDNFLNNINHIQNDFHGDLQKLVEKHGGILLRNTKQLSPVDTGQLRRSWELEKGDLYVKVFTNTSYAIHIEYGHRTRQGTGHNNPGKKYKYKPKPNGIAYIEGVYMLKTSFEKTKKNFIEDLDKLLKKYGFK